MNQNVTVAPEPDAFRADVMVAKFEPILPKNIPVDRFVSVIRTALQNNPKLRACTRESLWNSCMKAAYDGLYPDGREGAIVPYGENEDGAKKADVATWMPMIAGIRKKARNSGEIKDWYVEVVYAGDHFRYRKGDDPRLEHEPVPPSERKGGIICAYSIAVLSDGYKTAPEVMWIEDIEKIRAKSKAKKGPWGDPTFYSEMCKKTVARRHSKSLPTSTDLDQVMSRDDDLYDLGAQEDRPMLPPPAPTRGVKRVIHRDAVATPDEVPTEVEVIDETPPQGNVRPTPSTGSAAANSAGGTTQTTEGGEANKPAMPPSPKAKGAQPATASPQEAPPAAQREEGPPPAPQARAAKATVAPAAQGFFSDDERQSLLAYSERLMGSMSSSGLQRRTQEYFSDNLPDEATSLGQAVEKIFNWHVERIKQRMNPADLQTAVKKLLS